MYTYSDKKKSTETFQAYVLSLNNVSKKVKNK